MRLFKKISKAAGKAAAETVENATDAISEVAEQAGETARSFNKGEQGTKRQALDMLSDSKLSKAIRPLAIIWILTLFTVCLVANWCGLETDEKYQELIFWALLCVLGFYFPGRDLVKAYTKNKK